MNIEESTMIFFYNIERETYEMRPFEMWTAERVPMCTAKHFWHVIGKFFETVYPQLGDNPLSQNIDWGSVRDNNCSEIEGTPEVQI